MRSLLALAYFIFSFATIGCSQKITEKDIPAPVKTAFNNKFPGATDIKWEKENKKELEANFKMNMVEQRRSRSRAVRSFLKLI